MEIRALTQDDADAWLQLRRSALETEPFAFSKSVDELRAITPEAMAQRFRQPPEAALNVGAFENGRLVGMATFIRETGAKSRHKGRIYAVYVSAAERGKGIGRALVTELIQVAKQQPSLEQILLSVASSQAAARALYRSLGFEIYGTEPRALKVGSEYVDEDHMILRIR